MQINIKGIVIIVGNYGSGKTEISVNLAANQKHLGTDVSIADLDLVNPYFRTREAIKQLSELGIQVIVPPTEYLKADLPILSPDVSRIIRKHSELTILDAGGDDVGATVLAALADSLQNKNIQMLQIVNPFRPFTDTITGCIKIRDQIQQSAKLKITGIIGNPNLIDQTTEQDIYNGYKFVNSYSKEVGLPLEFIAVSEEFLPTIDLTRFSCPVLPIKRQLVPPWKEAKNL